MSRTQLQTLISRPLLILIRLQQGKLFFQQFWLLSPQRSMTLQSCNTNVNIVNMNIKNNYNVDCNDVNYGDRLMFFGQVATDPQKSSNNGYTKVILGQILGFSIVVLISLIGQYSSFKNVKKRPVLIKKRL